MQTLLAAGGRLAGIRLSMLHEAVRSLLEIGACIGAGAAFKVFGLFDGADAQVLGSGAKPVFRTAVEINSRQPEGFRVVGRLRCRLLSTPRCHLWHCRPLRCQDMCTRRRP